MDAVSSALIEPVTNSVLDLVKKHVDYIRYRQNVGELDERVEQLEHEKARVDHQCNRAVKNGHNIEVKAREWSRQVGEFKTEVENYKNDEGHRKAGLTKCLFPYFSYRLGRLAKKKAVEGKKLIDGCMEEHRCCTDQYYQTLDPWHSYTQTHTHQIPSACENHMYSLVAGKSGRRS